MVRDGISGPLFLHFDEQYHPVYCRLALHHFHARSDKTKVEQVECLLQLQHCAIYSRARHMDG